MFSRFPILRLTGILVREDDIINAYPVDKKYAAKIFKDYGG